VFKETAGTNPIIDTGSAYRHCVITE